MGRILDDSQPLQGRTRSLIGNVVDAMISPLLERRLGEIPAALELADGTTLFRPAATSVATIELRDRAVLLDILARSSLGFGERYVDGSIRVTGDLVGLLERSNRLSAPDGRMPRVPFRHALARGYRVSRRASASNAAHHYDLGNDFYALWLDPSMNYTCAYYDAPETTLAQAQTAKMERVCSKLALRAGERVVEAGSGWGALAVHMAERHGVRVRAFNVSTAQLEYSREQAERRGVSGLIEWIHGDYREIGAGYDAFVSVGMLEALGPGDHSELGRTMGRAVGNDGRGLLHSIGRNQPYPTDPWIDRYIFPQGYAPSLAEMLSIFESSSLSVLDVENLRIHYVRTLADWLERFEGAATEIERQHDERFVRMWRLYLSAAQAAFRAGWLQLFQVKFAPGLSDRLPKRVGDDGPPGR